ncbi:MAG: YceI family protein, partial [Sphingomonadaceae bacterium]
FDVNRFATAKFVSTSVTVDGTTAKIAGTLTLKGITKPVTLDAKFTGAGMNPFSKRETVGFSATTAIKRSDWSMGTGIPLVGDDVALRISVAFEKAG